VSLCLFVSALELQLQSEASSDPADYMHTKVSLAWNLYVAMHPAMEAILLTSSTKSSPLSFSRERQPAVI
jgi:hypothetical protein